MLFADTRFDAVVAGAMPRYAAAMLLL